MKLLDKLAKAKATSFAMSAILAVSQTIGCVTPASAETPNTPTEAVSTSSSENLDVKKDSAATDDVTYITEHMDKSLVGDGELKANDILTTVTTMVSKDSGVTTIDDLWKNDPDGTPVSERAFEGQYYNDVLLYEAGPDSDYYVARASSLGKKPIDSVAVRNDTTGTVYDDVKVDADNGLVYVPKKYRVTNEDGKLVLDSVRVQLLYAVGDDTTTPIDVTVDADDVRGDLAPTGTAQGNLLDDQTSINLSDGDNKVPANTIDNVTVNGVEYQLGSIANGDMVEYTDDGNLVVNMPPVCVTSVTVNASDNLGKDVANMFGGIARALALTPARADGLYAAASEPNYISGWWDTTGDPQVGATIHTAGKNGYQSGGVDGWTWPVGPGTPWSSDQGPTLEAWKAVQNGTSVNLDNLVKYANIHNGIERNAIIYQQTAKTSNGVTVYIDEAKINLYCAHANQPANPGFLDDKGQTIRILKTVDKGGWYDVWLGIINPSLNEQSGAGIFKVHWVKSTPPTGYVQVKKESSCPNIDKNNRLYTLKGAEFQVIDGSGKVVATLTTDENGDTPKTQAIPAGTYTIHESKAPEGFMTTKDAKVTISTNGQTVTAKMVDEPATDPLRMLVAKYDAEKQFSEDGNIAQGSATLAGAEFTVYYYDTLSYDNADALAKAGEKPLRTWTFKTDEKGYCYFADKSFVGGDDLYYNTTSEGGAAVPTIPRGTIIVKETKAPAGYNLGNATPSFQKINPKTSDSTEAISAASTQKVPEDVIRGDVEFHKVDDKTDKPLANIPFKVTSKTTGESHIVVTDENGYFSSSSTTHKHTNDTNKNDSVKADESGVIDCSKLDPSAGVWFGSGDPDDSKAAMPYDTYTIEELRCTNNANRNLIGADTNAGEHVDSDSVAFVVDTQSKSLSLGTLRNITPSIHTMARDKSDLDQTVVDGEQTIVDEVTYTGLVPGRKYVMSAELRYADDKADAVTIDGKAVTGTTEFVPTAADGSVKVDLTFDSAVAAGKRIVVFETLTEKNSGYSPAEHKDKDDANQTVTVPTPDAHTTATDDIDGDKHVVSDPEVTIKDTVSYTNLKVGQEYTVRGTLMDKATGKALLDADGNEVTAETKFTPKSSDGTTVVTFKFDGSKLADESHIVVFEDVIRDGKTIISHADINDEDQTVTVDKPHVATQASDGIDGDQNVIVDSDITINDTVAYENLIPGKEYTLKGTLMDKATGKALLDADGNEVTAETKFTPKNSDGTTVVTFKFDGSNLKKDQSLVAFESLERNDHELASHADIEDKPQTVTTVESTMGTTATDKLDGDKTVVVDSKTAVTDDVAYQNVIPNRDYTMVGILMDAETGLPIMTGDGAGNYSKKDLEAFMADLAKLIPTDPQTSIDCSKLDSFAQEHKDIMSHMVFQTKEFAPATTDGTVSMDYTFDANGIITDGKAKETVVFEAMFEGKLSDKNTPSRVISIEADKDNKGQTVTITPSSIGTTATDKTDGDHEMLPSKDASIVDTVAYENLIPGKEYTVKGTLMDKATGKPLMVNDHKVTAETKFIPEAAKGTVDVTFTFDASALDGHDLVAFEELHAQQVTADGSAVDKTVAEHKDINDEAQTVTVTSAPKGGKYGKTGVDMTAPFVAVVILAALGLGAAVYAKKKSTAKDSDEE